MKQAKNFTVLLMIVLVLSLAACGQAPDTEMSENTEIQAEESEMSEESDSESTSADTETSEPEAVDAESFQTVATIEETVLVDENNVKITATELNYTNYSVELSLTIENNSEKDLSFISGSMGYSCNAINGYMVDDGYMNAEVAAGKKANESISFSIDELAIYGITEIADIQVGFDIQDDDYEHFYSGPRQVKTTAVESYDYATDTYQKAINSGILQTVYDYTIDYYAADELYNQNGISIASEALMTNKDGEKVILLEIVNNTSELVYGVTTDISVNGLVVYSGTWSSDSINPGTRRIMDLSISSMLDKGYWDVLGIADIGDFACSFTVKDSDYENTTESQDLNINIAEGVSKIDASGAELYNENGIRIIFKGLVEDSFEYSDDIHMLLLVESNYADAISISDSYDSLSINGLMTDYIVYGLEVPSEKYAIIDVAIQASSLEKNKISGIEDIEEAEMTFEIRDDSYDTIAEPKVYWSKEVE
uniref:hypothetical protein n=1 Tax=Agathobacter sp. TaxID=2021311 RepID=UPI004057C55C